MFPRFLFTLLICLSPLLSASEKDPFHPQAIKEKTLDQRENYFRTSTDYTIHPNVNPITGELNEEETDLVIAGCQPISLRRFYNHTSPYDPRYASWRYNPEAFLVANLEWQNQETFAAIGEADGSISSLKRSPSNYSLFTYELPKNFAHFKSDGATHPSTPRSPTAN
jgi:hypothetical protein